MRNLGKGNLLQKQIKTITVTISVVAVVVVELAAVSLS